MSNTRKILHAFCSLLIVIATILAPIRQAQANAYGVAVTAASWAQNAVSITAAVAGAVKTVRLPPMPPAVAAAIIAGAGGAWIGNWLYEKYGDKLLDWAIDESSGEIKVTLKSDSACSSQSAANAMCVSQLGASSWAGSISAVSTGAGQYACQGSSYPGYNLTFLDCGSATNPNVRIPATDAANAAIAAANAGNAAAQKLVVDATAANVKPEDMAKDNSKPVDPTTPFDPSSIIAAIQSLFSMLQGLLTQLLAAIQSIVTTITNAVIDLENYFKSLIQPILDFVTWAKTTAQTWADNVVKEYQTLKDAIVKEYTDARDWVYSDSDLKDMKDKDTSVDIPQSDVTPVDTSVNFGGSCPADVAADIMVFGSNLHIPIFEFSKYCGFLSTYMRPVVILLASFWAVLIVGRSSSESS